MKEYSKCMGDIESSLEAGYPKAARYKLLERKVKCLVSLGNVTGKEITHYCTFLSTQISFLNVSIRCKNIVVSSDEHCFV